jgi:hypothetical protein
MQELRSLIYFMRPADKEAALNRFEARFDAVGPEGEAALIQELGSPLKQVVLLERDYRSKMAAEEELQEPDAPEPPPEAAPLPAEEPQAGSAASVPDMDQDDIPLPDTEEMEPMIVTAQPPRKEPISAWRKILAILLTVPLLPLTMLALAVSLVVCAVPLASGAGLGACGVYLIAFGIVVMGYLPDILMLIGAGLAGAAVALVLVWFGLWLLILGIRCILNVLRAIYRGVLRGGASNV